MRMQRGDRAVRERAEHSHYKHTCHCRPSHHRRKSRQPRVCLLSTARKAKLPFQPNLMRNTSTVSVFTCESWRQETLSHAAAPYLPVHGVVAPVADVDGNLAIRSLKHRVACVSLQVVGALVEVTHTRDVILQVAAFEGWNLQET